MSRVFNFSAGPAAIPEAVLQQAQAELLDFRGSGMSVMEMSHRGKVFLEVAAEVERDFRELLAVPANYKTLFLQGGGKGEFSLVPMNLLRGKHKADYVNTGHWSSGAIKEAAKYCEVAVIRHRKIASSLMCPGSQSGDPIAMRPSGTFAATRRFMVWSISGRR